jgi:uncharacterized protein (DUF1501 family)
MLHSRRSFLKNTLSSSTLLALTPTVPGFLAQTARAARTDKESKVLVVIEMGGGNDGINTVVPFKDEGYAKHRKILRLPTGELHKLNNDLGLNRAMFGAAKLWDDGRLAIVQGVGYPNPTRSHFEDIQVWWSAHPKREDRDGYGWLGRGLDTVQGGQNNSSLHIGPGSLPIALRGTRSMASAIEKLDDYRPEAFSVKTSVHPRAVLPKDEPADKLAAFVQRSMLDAYAMSDKLSELSRRPIGSVYYPDSRLGEELRAVSTLLKLDFGTRVFYVGQPGYDTHTGQLYKHASLLGDLSRCLQAFLDDLGASKLADRVAVLCFSEFGRRVDENASDGGTDHGTAGPVFVAGPAVKPGLLGDTPSLSDLDDNGDLKMGMDFRRVYATVLEDWLGLSAKVALAGTFDRLPLFRV